MGTATRIVIVDDDEHIRELASVYLQKEGYDVVCVVDGTSAVARILQLQPGVVILDLMLPGLSGYDVCKQVRQESARPDHHAHRAR